MITHKDTFKGLRLLFNVAANELLELLGVGSLGVSTLEIVSRGGHSAEEEGSYVLQRVREGLRVQGELCLVKGEHGTQIIHKRELET